MVNLREALGQVIRELRLENGMTLRGLSQLANVSLGYLSEIERGHKEASSEILESLADGMGLPLSQIVIEAGYRIQEWDTTQKFIVKELDKELIVC